MAAGGVVVLVGGAGGDDGAGAAPGVGVDIFPDPSIQYKIYQQNSALFKKCRSPPPPSETSLAGNSLTGVPFSSLRTKI